MIEDRPEVFTRDLRVLGLTPDVETILSELEVSEEDIEGIFAVRLKRQ